MRMKCDRICSWCKLIRNLKLLFQVSLLLTKAFFQFLQVNYWCFQLNRPIIHTKKVNYN